MMPEVIDPILLISLKRSPSAFANIGGFLADCAQQLPKMISDDDLHVLCIP